MRASGLAPRFLASDSVIITSAAAPSEIDEEVAAVTVPSLLNAGRRVGIFSTFTLNGVSSSATTSSPLRPLTVTGAISSLNSPALEARTARSVEVFAYASMSSREKPYFFAVASAKWPMGLPS